MMRAAAVDPEAVGDVLLLATVLRQRAHQRERVVEGQRVDALSTRREPPEHRDVELHAVVGNQEIVADKGAKLREDFAERGRVAYIRVTIAVDGRRLGRDRAIR